MNRFLMIFLLTIVASVACHAAITVQTDRNPVSLNESFKLAFDITGSSADDPDFSPLQKDFQILSTSQNSYYSMVNGKISASKQWTLTLIANTAGTLTIPSISFGNEQSPEATIEVKDEAGGGGKQDEYVYLDASVTTNNPYVQSQVIYTLKLYRSVAIVKASLGDPVISEGSAVIESIGEDKTYDTVQDGKTWQVIERNYAIYPQSSSIIKISPVSFMGQITRNSYGINPFDPPPRTVIRRSAEVVLDVRPVPAAFTGSQWLPAQNLTVAEQWSVDPSSLRAGEPVTRTLIVNATGLTSSQIPELPGWPLTDVKYYPDQPELSDERSDTGIIGTRSEQAAIIPNRAGSFVLPEITIPWWNVITDKLEYAVVPERTLQVQGGASGNVPTNVQPAEPQQTVEPASRAASEPPVISDPVPLAQDTHWKWISMALLALWLSTLLVWWQKSKSAVHPAAVVSGNKGRLQTAVKQVIEACKQHNPQATRQQLLQWGRLAWPADPPSSLAEISLRMSSEMAAEIRKLNDALYSRAGMSWSGDGLAMVFAKESAQIAIQKKPVEQGKLEPLYRL